MKEYYNLLKIVTVIIIDIRNSLLIHHSFKLFNLFCTILITHSVLVSLFRMSLIVFLLKDHRPIVKLGGGVFKNL